MSRVLTPPDPPETGLTLAVIEDDGDLFPNAPFRAIAFRNQKVPDIGTDSCYINVTAVDDDVFTFTREDPTAAIYRDMNIAVVSTMAIYANGATIRISGIFPEGPGDDAGTLTLTSPLGVVSAISEIGTGKIIVLGPGSYYYDLVATTGGIWKADWLGPDSETVQAQKFFVEFE